MQFPSNCSETCCIGSTYKIDAPLCIDADFPIKITIKLTSLKHLFLYTAKKLGSMRDLSHRRSCPLTHGDNTYFPEEKTKRSIPMTSWVTDGDIQPTELLLCYPLNMGIQEQTKSLPSVYWYRGENPMTSWVTNGTSNQLNFCIEHGNTGADQVIVQCNFQAIARESGSRVPSCADISPIAIKCHVTNFKHEMRKWDFARIILSCTMNCYHEMVGYLFG